MTHALDPIAFSWGGFVLSWYWLSYFAGLVLVMTIGLKQLPLSKQLSPYEYLHYLQWGLPLMLLSSRAVYVLFYHPAFFLEHPQLIPQFWRGGMSFHGALLGPLFYAWWLARKKQAPLTIYTDVVVLALPWALALGRLANFINGELYGRPTDLPWGMIFPLANDGIPRHPSQLYQALTEGLLLGCLLWRNRHRLKTPGELSRLFLLGYGAFRFLVEFTRAPDPQLGTFLGLSLGQYFCLAMVATALLWQWRTSRSDDTPPQKPSP